MLGYSGGPVIAGAMLSCGQWEEIILRRSFNIACLQQIIEAIFKA